MIKKVYLILTISIIIAICKSTHNHYSDDDNVVAHEYLGDGNARIYFGNGRSEVVPTG